MISAADVSNFYIDMYMKSEDCMTNLRLNKFLYFAQGWSLVRLKKPLFNDTIEAWDYGPVVPNVYHKYYVCGKMPIDIVSESYSEKVFTKEQKDLLLDIANKYGKYSTGELVNISHMPGSPWSAVYARSSSREIPLKSIADYFSKEEPLETFDIKKILSGMKTAGRRDENGHMILPADWDE